ncbi:DUF930 domain-containing protein [Rhizobium tropici]|uniref:DUF930 domain-containing protein n=1 Tax=Rhizobium tropici TaxID=398 RepID=A0A5B0W8D4_RHITR|nr:DUF930 domain-containing protein [Rhizobium tropici]KAA1182778.1 DUF930 domain-containing protein [Rhizobium tropici]
MEKAAEKRDREIRPGFVLSILLHVLFVAIFLLPLLPAPPEAKPEQSVNVELVPQQEEKQELATKANEKPDQPPKPMPKPDEKPAEQAAETQQEPQQPQGKKADEQPPKQSDPQGKEAAEKPPAKLDEAKADKPVEQVEKPAPKPDDPGADKPVDKAEQQASATETPPEAKEKPLEPRPSDPDPKQKGANSEDEDLNKEDSSSASKVENATLSPKINDSQPLKESQTSAAAGDKDSPVAAQATENPTTSESEIPQSTTADSNSQLQNSEPSERGEPNESGMGSLNSDQPSQSASISTPQVLATDSSSDTKVDPSDELQSRKDAANVTVPGVMASGQPKTGEAKNSPGNSPTEGGTGLVIEPTLEQRGQTSPSKPTEGEQKASAAASPKAGFAASAGQFVQAKRLYSADELSRLPKGFLAQWKQLSAQMRISQLCNSEGAAQLNAAGLHILRFGLPHSSESRSASRSIETDKAVYRTSDGYHYVGVKCNVDSGAMKVVSFAYRLGAPIPQDQWKNLNLPTN